MTSPVSNTEAARFTSLGGARLPCGSGASMHPERYWSSLRLSAPDPHFRKEGACPNLRPRLLGRDVQREERPMSAFIITRIHVGDYEAWRPMFDQDRPQARENAR